MPRLSKLTEARQMKFEFAEGKIPGPARKRGPGGKFVANPKNPENPDILEQTKAWLSSKLEEYFNNISKDLGIVLKNKATEIGNEVVNSIKNLLPLPEKTSIDRTPSDESHVVLLLTDQIKILKDIKDSLSDQSKTEKEKLDQEKKYKEEAQEIEEGKERDKGKEIKSTFSSDISDMKRAILGISKMGAILSGIFLGISALGKYALDHKEVLDKIANFVENIYKIFFDPQSEHKKSQEEIEENKKRVTKLQEINAKEESGKLTKQQADIQRQKLTLTPKKEKALVKAENYEANRKEWANKYKWLLFSDSMFTAEGRRKGQEAAEKLYDFTRHVRSAVMPESDEIPTHEDVELAKQGKGEWKIVQPEPVVPNPAAELEEKLENKYIPAAAQAATNLKNKTTEIGTGVVTTIKNLLPSSEKHLSNKEIQTILNKEYFKDSPYWDPKGQNKSFSIGYGTRIDDNPELKQKYGTPDKPTGNKITKEEAFNLAKSKINKIENEVNNNIKVPITQSTFTSLVDLGYNAGLGAVSTKSSIIQKINNNDLAGAQKELLHYRITGQGLYDTSGHKKILHGLEIRRKEESIGMTPVEISPPESIPNPSTIGETIITGATQNALANSAGGNNVNAPVVIAPKTSIATSQTSTITPVNVNNNEDTYLWSTRHNAQFH